jgi:hypothetical protein
MSNHEFRNRPMKTSHVPSRSPAFATIPADDAMCMVDSDSQMCTLMFFNKHAGLKHDTEYGMVPESIEYELRLELKFLLQS